MAEKKPDRRVQRTRELLQSALMQLIKEKGYDAITIQDITERANLGRTTFYLHYQGKDELLLDHHTDFIAHLNLERLSRDELLGDNPTPAMVSFFAQTYNGQAVYLAFTRTKDADIIMRGVRQRMADSLQDSLRTAFPDSTPNLPMDVLTHYIIGAQLSLVDWWITNRKPYTPEQITAMLHRLQRTAVCDAYGI